MSKITVVLSSSRFGGRYLLDLIGQAVPGAIVLQEAFRKGSDSHTRLSKLTGYSTDDLKSLSRVAPEKIWDKLNVAAEAREDPIFLRVFHYHQNKDSALWKRIHNDACVLHLIRSNLFEAFISREIAMQLKTWNIPRGQSIGAKNARIDVDKKALETFILERREQIDWGRNLFSNADYHEIFFEDITRSPGSCLRAIEKLVNIPESVWSKKLSSKFERMRSRSNADIVANYSNVAIFDRGFY